MNSAPLPPDQSTGTYDWRVVAFPAVVTEIQEDGKRKVAAPGAKQPHHRLVVVRADAQVGDTGELRYVSHFPHWGRLEFEPRSVGSDEDHRGR